MSVPVVHKVIKGYLGQNNNPIYNIVDAFSGNDEILFSGPIAAPTTNRHLDINFLMANVHSLSFLADHACSILFNSSGSPTYTITLAANEPWEWDEKQPGTLADLITSDVTTGIYVTNPSGVNIVALEISGCQTLP